MFAALLASCFDALYEPLPGTSWTVCCRAGSIDTCECLDPDHCTFALTACAQNTCVERGICGGTGGSAGSGGSGGSTDAGIGTGGGSANAGGSATAGGAAGGSATAGGSAGSGGAGGGFVPEDAGEPLDAGFDAGASDAGADAGPADAGFDAGRPDAGFDAGVPDAGPVLTGYQPCCAQGHVGSCACYGTCSAPPFTACSRGRCVAVGASCPP
ncbi:MAG: hypothetical protein IPJ65_09035 [Archangiaceae bacterium]|nr:hypothetical protein [Archangiaceae bacterium]